MELLEIPVFVSVSPIGSLLRRWLGRSTGRKARSTVQDRSREAQRGDAVPIFEIRLETLVFEDQGALGRLWIMAIPEDCLEAPFQVPKRLTDLAIPRSVQCIELLSAQRRVDLDPE
jgi:hypothetical protein